VRVGYPVGCGEVAWTNPTESAVGPYISMGPGELGVGKARFTIDGDVGRARDRGAVCLLFAWFKKETLKVHINRIKTLLIKEGENVHSI